jgi:branched-chain amino acid transport system ATP-binding protein
VGVSRGLDVVAIPSPHALEFDHVSACYGPYRALFDVSFQVPAGGVVALIGSNGAGKSTVTRAASGLLPTSEGSIWVAGADVTRWPAYKVAQHGVASVPEGRAIFSRLTVEENLTIAFRQRLGRKLLGPSFATAYKTYPVLAEKRTQLAGTLSGGQQRLLSLAKVLVAPPKLLVADELCLGLAPLVVDTVYEALGAVNRTGTALLVVEQQIDRVLNIADRAVILEHGSVIYDGEPAGATQAMEQVLQARGERSVMLDREWSDGRLAASPARSSFKASASPAVSSNGSSIRRTWN